MEIKKVFVVGGAGAMGSGIVQLCAQAGYTVTMEDVSEEAMTKAMDFIKWSVGKLVEKGRVQGTVDGVVSRIKFTIKMEDARNADFVIESVFEDLKLKRDVFRQLEDICPPETILATNTTGLPITYIAEGMKRPEKFVGTHFFIPVPMMRIVEVVKGVATSEDTMQVALKFCQSLGHETVRVNKDVFGFALARVEQAAYVEAIRLVEEGVASVEDIDKGMRLGYGRAMGPFETRDLTGLENAVHALQNLYEETGDHKFIVPTILRRKVKAGHLGKKVGVGWYRYDENGNKIGPA